MKMLNFILWTILLLVALLFIGDFSVSFRPEFTMSLPRWRMSVSVFFFFLALSFIQSQFERDGWKKGIVEGYNRGFHDGVELVDKALGKDDKDESPIGNQMKEI